MEGWRPSHAAVFLWGQMGPAWGTRHWALLLGCDLYCSGFHCRPLWPCSVSPLPPSLAILRCKQRPRTEGEPCEGCCVSFPGEVGINDFPTTNQQSGLTWVQPGKPEFIRPTSGTDHLETAASEKSHPSWATAAESCEVESRLHPLLSASSGSSWHFPVLRTAWAGLLTAGRAVQEETSWDLGKGSNKPPTPFLCRSINKPFLSESPFEVTAAQIWIEMLMLCLEVSRNSWGFSA